MPALTLEQQVGQLFVVVVDTQSAARDEDLIRGGLVSGALLRWDRFTAAELAALTAWLRARAPEGLPYLVFADHEGGPMFTQRSFGATVFPGNMALGAAGSEALAEAAAAASARELSALGVHADFAPAVDVNSNPKNPIIGVRSYGSDPALAARLGAAQVRGYAAGGVLAVAKHFPGHGDTAVDSHVGLPNVDRPRASFDAVELPPFKAAIAAGVPMVMPAHVIAPALGAVGVPVTFSSAALAVLRRELGFSGVIVSDSLDMGAITKSTPVPEAAVLSFLAGCDLLLTGKTDYRQAHAYFVAAVRSGRVPKARLDESLARIAKLKAALPRTPPLAPDLAAGPALAKKVAEAALTLVRGALPLKAGKGAPVLIAFRPKSSGADLERFAKAFGFREAVFLDPKPSKADAEAARAAAAKAGALVVGTYLWGGEPPKEQRALASELFALGKPSVHLSLMNPYDADDYPQAGAVLALYGPTPAMLDAAAAALKGELQPKGRMPVRLE